MQIVILIAACLGMSLILKHTTSFFIKRFHDETCGGSPRYVSWRGCLSAAAIGFVWIHFLSPLPTAVSLILFFNLAAITCVDARTQIIPDTLHAVGVLLFFSYLYLYAPDLSLLNTVEDVLFFIILVALCFYLGKYTGGSGLGMGDFKLLAWLMLFLPGKTAVVCLLAAILSVPMLAKLRFNRRKTFAFGPYLAISFMLLISLQTIL